MTVIEVAAGLIHRDGRYLIARRKAGVHLAGYWEFPAESVKLERRWKNACSGSCVRN
jgi:hypothetical protein